jgi:hypothetical protein
MAANSEVAVQLAVLQLKYDLLEEKVEELEKKSEKVSKMADRWKGGGAALIALGSLAGFVFTYYDKFKGFFVKLGAS